MTTFDLETTYLGLDGQGKVTTLPVGPDFWQTIGDNPGATGTLISLFTSDGDWPHWEMHPAGDEVLVALEGDGTIVFDRGHGPFERHALAAGGTLVIPAGVWHFGLGQRGLKVMFMTYGAGTEHRPVTDEHRARLEQAV